MVAITINPMIAGTANLKVPDRRSRPHSALRKSRHAPSAAYAASTTTIHAMDGTSAMISMDEGLISVEYIGKDATTANLIFKNRGEEPLDVALPEVFGAVHILQQGMMGGMGGGMGGMMRVEPDRPRKMTVATVCLEHGKADPNPKMRYKVVRLSEVNPSGEINQLCRALGRGQVSQNIAQAAAWHIANDRSWQEPASKPRVISEYTGIEYYFNPVEIQNALRLTSMVTIAAENAPRSDSLGNSAVTTGETALLESPGERDSK